MSAVRPHQLGSPLKSLTTPDMNMKRNRSQRESQTPVVGTKLISKRDNCRFQKERVPLKAHEGLSGIEQRKIERIDENEADTRQEIEDQHQRQAGPRPAHRVNRDVAVVQPEHHRHEDETLRPEARKRVDQSGQRQDAAAADQSLRLDGEGNEGRKRNEPEQAQEQERDELVARRLVVPAPEQEA